MSTATENQKVRITARIPAELQSRLEEASSLRGMSTNNFIVQAALKEANQILADEKSLHFTEEAVERMIGLMTRPPKATSVSRRAKRLHDKLIGE